MRQFIVNVFITVYLWFYSWKSAKCFVCFILFLMNKINFVWRISFVICMRSVVQALTCCKMKLCNFHVRVIMVMTSYDNKKFWNVLQGVHILGELHLEWGWTGNRGNFRHPGWESPVSGHWPVDREYRTPQGRAGMSELTPGTYRWMTDTYSYIYSRLIDTSVFK